MLKDYFIILGENELMEEENCVQQVPESAYLLLCTAAGRVILTSGSMQLLVGEDFVGRNLNDFIEDGTAAQIIAAAAWGEALDFECVLANRRFVCSSENLEGNICIHFFPVGDDGRIFMGMSAASLLGREMNNSLSVMFLAMGQIRPQLIGQAREDAAVLMQNLYKLLRLSHNLSDCAQAENGLLHLHITEEDAVKICTDLVSRLKEPCLRRGIQLALTTPDAPVICRIDREKLERMILNLVSNSINAQKDGGNVGIELEERDGQLLITVSDSGPGMRDCGTEATFRKFCTADPADPESVGGAGFGMALCRAFAELHGGRIIVVGGAGGASVTIQLPLNASPMQTPLSADPPDYAGGVDRVLLELSTALNKESYY